LVTGASGFIGAALTRLLLETGHHVIGLDTRPPAIDHLAYRFVRADIRNHDALATAADGCPVIFHLAGNTENRPGGSFAAQDYDITVGGTVALLAALPTTATPTIVLSSSQLVYGGSAGRATEESPMRPETPFAAAKVACEAFLQAYVEQAGGAGIACRLANIVGPGVPRGVVADLCHRLQENPAELEVLGDGQQRRSYVDVVDCARALLLVASTTQPGFAAINVSNQDSITAGDVARIVVSTHRGPAPEIRFTGGQAWQGDATELHPSADRLQERGWCIRRNSETAVRAAVEAAMPPAISD